MTGVADLTDLTSDVLDDPELVARLTAEQVDLTAVDARLTQQLRDSFRLRVVVRFPDGSREAFAVAPGSRTALDGSSSELDATRAGLLATAGVLAVVGIVILVQGERRRSRTRRRSARAPERPRPSRIRAWSRPDRARAGLVAWCPRTGRNAPVRRWAFEDGRTLRPCPPSPDRKRCSPPCASWRRARTPREASTASCRPDGRARSSSATAPTCSRSARAASCSTPSSRPSGSRSWRRWTARSSSPPTARASPGRTCTSSPIPNVPTSETGTRHRTAERVGRQIDVPVITVSEDMSVVAIHRRGAEADARADPAGARPRRPGPADPRALQGAPRRGERLAVGARGRGPRHRARRRHRAPARRDGAAHRRGDRGLRHRARRRRPAGPAPARGARSAGSRTTAGSSPRTTSSTASTASSST